MLVTSKPDGMALLCFVRPLSVSRSPALPFSATSPQAYCIYWIHHRERMRELLENTILFLAVIINILLTAFHNQKTEKGEYDLWEKVIIYGLSWAVTGLTVINFVVWGYLQVSAPPLPFPFAPLAQQPAAFCRFIGGGGSVLVVSRS